MDNKIEHIKKINTYLTNIKFDLSKIEEELELVFRNIDKAKFELDELNNKLLTKELLSANDIYNEIPYNDEKGEFDKKQYIKVI